jgi:hypothetical protein
MEYDLVEDRWVVDMGLNRYALHCGDGLDIYIGEQKMPCSIELDKDWYIIMRGARFYLHQSETYYVEV